MTDTIIQGPARDQGGAVLTNPDSVGDTQVIGTLAIMSGAVDPNNANAGVGTALPAHALTGIYVQSAADGGGVRGSMWINDTGTPRGWVNTRGVGDAVIFGDGSDGDLNIVGTVNEAGASHRYYNNINIPAAGHYKPNGRRIFVKDTLTIAATGNVLADADNGAAGGAAGALGGAQYSYYAGTNGGAGGVAGGAVGGNSSGNTRSFIPGHGQGGAGGAGSGGAGGAAGVQTGIAGNEGNYRSAQVAGGSASVGSVAGIAAGTTFPGGTGGGGGGGDNPKQGKPGSFEAFCEEMAAAGKRENTPEFNQEMQKRMADKTLVI